MIKKKIFILLSIIALSTVSIVSDQPRPGARDIGIEPGILPPGKLNAITDVSGVTVGHKTIVKDKNVRTGVTAILPHGGNIFQNKVPAAVYTGNGFGKLAGISQVEELGNIETPIILTNTLSVGEAVKAVVKYTLNQEENRDVYSVNAVVGETNDGYLNDIRGMHVTETDVIDAVTSAKSGPVEEGCVGAGTGTVCHGFKGGIGTSSRVLPDKLGGYTVGVLVQSNFGGILSIDGAPVGLELGVYSYSKYFKNRRNCPDGSCMIVIATDAPLSPRNLKRMAKRAVLGLARTGSFMNNGSGDYVIAFSTAYRIPYKSETTVALPKLVSNDYMSMLFLAVVESTEEAVYNSILKAETTSGCDGHRIEAIPINKVIEICKKHNVIK